MSHKKEWDSFNRAIKSRKNFPVDLSSYVAKSKLCMFNAWLDAGRDWDQCRLIMERTHSNSDENLSGWIAKSGKDLVKEFGEEKGKQLMDKRYQSGLYYNSEDFPEDVMERMYYMRKPKEMTRREVVTNKASLQGEENLDTDMMKALLDESDGLFRAGAMPVDRALGSAGQKALLDGMVDGGVQAAPKRKPAPKPAEGSEEVKPKTQQELAADLMAAILAESTQARKKSMNLGAVNYAGELASQLLQYAVKMEKYYKTLQQAITSQVQEEDFFTKCFTKIEKERDWFTQASVRRYKMVTKTQSKLAIVYLIHHYAKPICGNVHQGSPLVGTTHEPFKSYINRSTTNNDLF